MPVICVLGGVTLQDDTHATVLNFCSLPMLVSLRPVASMRQTRQLPRMSSPFFYFSSLKILRNFGISDIFNRPPRLALSDFRPRLRACH